VADATSGISVLSVTLTTREKDPATEGVPLNRPDVLRVIPLGSPEVTVQK
jgi:hypothetical protein